MASMLVLASGILLFITPLIVLDAINRHRSRKVSFFVVASIIAALVCYTSMNDLPDAHEYARYWNAAFVFGFFTFGIIFTWAMLTPKSKKKR